MNGYRFTAIEESAAQTIPSLAAGTPDEPALAPGSAPTPSVRDRLPSAVEPQGLAQTTGRPEKMDVACLIDYKYLYNENSSAPQSWGSRSYAALMAVKARRPKQDLDHSNHGPIRN